MREILFKAKSENSGYSPETNGWVEGDLVHSIAGDTAISVPRYIDGIIKVNPETVSEYTEKTDSNGRKIFENDILKVHYNTFKEAYTVVVRFGEYNDAHRNDKGHLGFWIDFLGSEKDYVRKDICFWLGKSKVEVIGNIFDNPELVEGAQ